LQAENTYGFVDMNSDGIRSFGMGIGLRHFYHLYQTLWHLFAGDSARTRGIRVPLNRCLPPNAMLLYCSDFLESDGSLVDPAPLWRAVQRYDFIPVIIQDELEYSFPVVSRGTFLPLANPETGAREEAWISPKSARAIRARHEARYREMLEQFSGRGIHPVHLDMPDVEYISRQFDRYFRKRKGSAAA
jgi:hypothetical protein